MTALRPDWVTPERTALLIIDMQVDFALPDGAMGQSGADLSAVPSALASADRLAAAARGAGVPVIFVGLETAPETDLLAWTEGSLRRGADPERENALCRAGGGGAAFVGAQPRPGERIVRKRRYSGFLDTELEAVLRSAGTDTVVACGLTTECCVALTAFDAFQRGFHVLVAVDACAAYGERVHAAALEALQMNGVFLVTAEALVSAWSAAGPPGRAWPS